MTHHAHTDCLGLIVEGVAKEMQEGQQQVSQVVLRLGINALRAASMI